MDYLAYLLRKTLQDPARMVGSGFRWLAEARMDRRLGIWTQRRSFARPETSGGDGRPCQPVPYSVLEAIERHLRGEGFPLERFVDVGCGAGRPLAFFSRLPFERMTGIEIDPAVAALARRNLQRLRPGWARCGSLGILQEDALEADVDWVGAVVYLANPFGPRTMAAFAERLRTQLRARPGGRILLYYALPLQEEGLRAAFPGARRETLEGLEPCRVYHLDAAGAA
ncbi:MAG TPA: class I SAM-dependent methyltransferase [Holophagaceae bacterium]|nr:class I SAM-dependent methyltransferase [Holophagaceae bacterium]